MRSSTLLGGQPKRTLTVARGRQLERRGTPPSRRAASPAGSGISPLQTTYLSRWRGEIFGLLGPNGAGKSTTFKMMCGLLRPTEGTALVDGLDLYKAPSAARARLGYMAQKFSLYGDLSVGQNLEFFAGAYGLSGARLREAVARVAGLSTCVPHLKERAGALPLGFKQRLALCCAIMHEPPVLFLDEPTSGVDPLTRREFWGFINAMVARGVTIMVTTHFMDEAEYCDRVALIYRGKCIAIDTPEALQASVKSEARPHPTLEDAFIALVKAQDKEESSMSDPRTGRGRRIRALVTKETLQVARDPSSFIVAFVMPILLLFLFGFGISFDATRLKIGLVVEDRTPDTAWFLASLVQYALFRRPPIGPIAAPLSTISRRRASMASSCSRPISPSAWHVATPPASRSSPTVAIPTPQLSSAVTSKVHGNRGNPARAWLGDPRTGQIAVVSRFWFNPELESRRFLIPGSISLIEMMIGALLTALVVSREWERGTMEALLATPVSNIEFIIGKLVPNFAARDVRDGGVRGVRAVRLRHPIARLPVCTRWLHRTVPARRTRHRAVDLDGRAHAVPGEPTRNDAGVPAGAVFLGLPVRGGQHARSSARFRGHRAGRILRARAADDFPRWRHRLGAHPMQRRSDRHEHRVVHSHCTQNKATAGLSKRRP